MKKLMMLVLGAVLAIASPLAAHADSMNQISFSGPVSYTQNANGSTSVTFTPYSTSSTANALVGGTSTGIFANFTSFNPFTGQGTLATFSNFNTAQGMVSPLFTATAPNGQTVSFTVTSMKTNTDSAGFGVTGTGYYTFVTNGVTTTVNAGSFQFTTQGSSPNVTFSASNTVTPEPSSLVLLGTGLVSAAGMLVRRRRQVTA